MSKVNRNIIWLIVVAIILIVLIFVFSKNKKSSDTILLGGAYMLTGPTSLVGEQQKNATILAVEEVNKTGGINGKKIEVVQEDTQFNAKTALSAYYALKNRGIDFIIIGGSPVVAPIHPEVIKDNSFMIVTDATLPSYFDNNSRTCRIALTAKNFGPGLVKILQNHGYLKVATLYPDNEAGRGFYNEFEKSFKDNGGSIVLSEFYNASGSSDYRTSLLKLKSKQSSFDALVYQNITNTGEVMLKQIKEAGINTPIITDYYTINNPVIKDLKLMNGTEFVDYDYIKTVTTSDNPTSKSFKEAYRLRYSSDPSYFAASTYDAIMLTVQGIKNSGYNPTEVGEYISKLKDYEGVTGLLSFDNDCEVSRSMKFSKIVDGMVVKE
jgi:branched-chain amino acid transport system substrate-binding protein